MSGSSISSGTGRLPDRTANFAREFLSALFMSLRTAQIHDPSNQAYQAALARLHQSADALFAATGGFEVRIVDDTFFINSARLKFDQGSSAAMRTLRTLLEAQSLGGFSMESAPTAQGLLELIALIADRGGRTPEGLEQELRNLSIKMLGLQKVIDEPTSAKVDRGKVAVHTYAKLILAIRDRLQQLRPAESSSGGMPTAILAVRVVQDLVEQVSDRIDLLLRLATNTHGAAPEELHGANSCVLALAMGYSLGFHRRDLGDIGSCALFHHLGPYIIGGQARGHDLFAAAALSQSLADSGVGRSLFSRAMILSEQRVDAGEASAKPHPFSRVLRVASTYSRLVLGYGIQDNQARSPVDALNIMRRDPSGWLDGAFVDLLVNLLRAYPPGAQVVLKSGHYAIVSTPLNWRWDRPIVRVASRPPSSVDLMAESDGRFVNEVIGTQRFLGAEPAQGQATGAPPPQAIEGPISRAGPSTATASGVHNAASPPPLALKDLVFGPLSPPTPPPSPRSTGGPRTDAPPSIDVLPSIPPPPLSRPGVSLMGVSLSGEQGLPLSGHGGPAAPGSHGGPGAPSDHAGHLPPRAASSPHSASVRMPPPSAADHPGSLPPGMAPPRPPSATDHPGSLPPGMAPPPPPWEAPAAGPFGRGPQEPTRPVAPLSSPPQLDPLSPPRRGPQSGRAMPPPRAPSLEPPFGEPPPGGLSEPAPIVPDGPSEQATQPQSSVRFGRLRPDRLLGSFLAGKYRILEKIGEGGMGTVFLASQEPIDRQVAVKVLHHNLTNDDIAVKRFRREARVISKMRHPNTVTIYDFGQTQAGELYLVMEFLEGQTVAQLLRTNGPLPGLRAARIIRQACGSLGEAHEFGIIHRDLKPDNIFLTRYGDEQDFVKVLDFGLVKLADNDHTHTLTQQGKVYGTPRYMAPEQAEGKPIDGRSDIYTLGVVLYELLMGRPLFTAETMVALLVKHIQTPPPPMAAVRPDLDVDPRLESIVMWALAKKASDRPQTVKELARELERWEQEAQVSGLSRANPMVAPSVGATPLGLPMAPPPHTPPPVAPSAPAGRSHQKWTNSAPGEPLGKSLDSMLNDFLQELTPLEPVDDD